METRHCNRCGEDRPESGWSPSQWVRGGWCKVCYRDWHRNRYTPKNGQNDAPRCCVHCGVSFTPKARAASIFCSRSCKDRAKNAVTSREFAEAKPAVRVCLHCGATFGQERRADAIFCSARCNESAHAMQRKYRLRADDKTKKMGYLRALICERDRWRCGICGGRVNPAKAHPDPLCGSLDHIVPLSQGGTSEVTNLRLTHLRCNVTRRDKGGGEQLRII